MRQRYASHPLLNGTVIFIGLIAYMFLLNYIVIHVDFKLLENAEAYAVFAIQSSMGVNATFDAAGAAIRYANPQFGMQIIALCTGISELLFFAFLVLLMRGPGRGAKARGLAVFLPIIFMINMLRLLLVYPLALWFGVQAMWDIHWFIWKYGMFAVLMALFVAWYWFFCDMPAKSKAKKTVVRIN